jgi:hypothetical protein
MLARDGGMNVPNITQVPGSVATLPRTAAGGDTEAVRSAGATGDRSAHASPAANLSLARLAWFDVNGDGQIDPRSAASGGDATLLVPSYPVDLPTYARRANPPIGVHPSKVTGETRTPAPAASNAAQTNRAVEAYQRYGQTPPAAPVQAPTPVAAVPAPTPVATITPSAPVAPLVNATPSATADLTPNAVATPTHAA